MANDIRSFRGNVTRSAAARLLEVLGKERAAVASARLGMAFETAVTGAKNPDALLNCSPDSVGRCIALSAMTELYPGGSCPQVWLVPKRGDLQWWITHHGICELARRAGYQLMVVAAHADEDIEISFSEVIAHRGEMYPTNLNELRGVYVKIREISTGHTFGTPWVAASIIHTRKAASPNGSVWSSWPTEMAMKTALHYLKARGALPIQSDALTTAMNAEPRAIDTTSTVVIAGPATLLDAPAPKPAALLEDFQDWEPWWADMPAQDREQILKSKGISRVPTERDIQMLYETRGEVVP